MRGFFIGVVLLVGLSATILSLRPGGLRRQLRFAARRFRIALALGGAYVFGSLIIRLAFPTGALSDYGPAALAAVLAIAFLFIARDPVSAPGATPRLRDR
ncbi:MAG TPA: hypothetical protein VLU92_05310 [Candidatus Dormibacteraeota bacterium]|nr:hypothetical protein [Candidatus Dormibacteraeota bacterium]